MYPTKDSNDLFGFVVFSSSCKLSSVRRDAVSCSDLCVHNRYGELSWLVAGKSHLCLHES